MGKLTNFLSTLTKVSQKSGRRNIILYIPLERAFKVLLEFVLKSNPKRVDFKITIVKLPKKPLSLTNDISKIWS